MRIDEVNPEYIYEDCGEAGAETPLTMDLEDDNSVKNIGIDAEWDDTIGTVSLQIHDIDQNISIIIINSIYKSVDFVKSVLKECRSEGIKLYFSDFNEDENLVEWVIAHCLYPGAKKLTFNVFFYYSPKDLIIGFGYNNIKRFLLRGFKENSKSYIDQKSNISGRFSFFHRYILKDLYGLNSGQKRGLKSIAKSLCIDFPEKGVLDDFKETMGAALRLIPNEFIKYGLGDVKILYPIFLKKIENHNKTLVDTFNLPQHLLFTIYDFPLTQGALINRTYLKVFYHDLDKQGHLVEFIICSYRLGVLNTGHKNYLRNLSAYHEVLHLNIEEAQACTKEDIKRFTEIFFNYKVFEFSVLNSASVPYLLTVNKQTTSYLNSFVTGGRTIRERPNVGTVFNTADIDLVSCYGSALKDFIHPIGLPTLFSKTPNENYITLGEFFKKYKKELVPNLYKIVVSGDVGLKQDLIYSKIITKGSHVNYLKKPSQFHGDFDNLSFVNTKLALLTDEIINGTITYDVHDLMTKVCTKQELKLYYSLRVETAIFWKASDRVEESHDWTKAIFRDKNTYSFNVLQQGIKDQRSRKWFPYPIGKFISPLLDMRKEYKNKMKTASTDEEKEYYNSLQNQTKLNINTLFGCFASPYFPIGNVVVADNITAKARVHSWMMSKSLHCTQIITDGGSYSLHDVAYLRRDRKKPGMATFAHNMEKLKHSAIKYGRIHQPDFPQVPDLVFNKVEYKTLDDIALYHINYFWGPYNLKLGYAVEHKMENLAVKAAYWGKSHYAFLTYNPDKDDFSRIVTKVRGYTEYFMGEKNPIYVLLHNMLTTQKRFPLKLDYKFGQIQNISTWRRCIKSDPQYSIRPGDFIISDRKFRCNNNYYNFPFKESFLKADKATLNPDKVLFEKHFIGGYQYVMIAASIHFREISDLNRKERELIPENTHLFKQE